MLTYDPARLLGQVTVAAVSFTVETDIVVITDLSMLRYSQLSVFIDAVLGTATKITFGYYFSHDNGTTWFKLPVKDLTTNVGHLVDDPSYVDGTSPKQGSNIRTIEDIATSGANAFKVTALAATAASGALTLAVAGRDN